MSGTKRLSGLAGALAVLVLVAFVALLIAAAWTVLLIAAAVILPVAVFRHLAATVTPARMMGIEDLVGTVEVGKRADLIVVRSIHGNTL